MIDVDGQPYAIQRRKPQPEDKHLDFTHFVPGKGLCSSDGEPVVVFRGRDAAECWEKAHKGSTWPDFPSFYEHVTSAGYWCQEWRAAAPGRKRWAQWCMLVISVAELSPSLP